MKILTALVISLIFSTQSFSQEKEFEQIILTPKTSLSLPLDYKISRPRLLFPSWDNDYDVFYKYLTPALKKTQASMSYTNNNVVSSIIPNSIMQHAQLDTVTVVPDATVLVGIWRMLVFRQIRFNDSVYIPTKTYYRLADTLLDDRSRDEAFAIFGNDNFKLFAKAAGDKKFKKEVSSKYDIEGGRYIMLYKLSRSGAGVSQFGIDENGHLIINYPRVIENVKKGEYFSYYTIIDQYVYEKVK